MQRHFRNSALGLLAVLTPAMAWAREDAQLWTGATAVVNLGGKWRLSEEVIARFSDRRHGLYEIKSNTLVGFRLTKNMTSAAQDLPHPRGEVIAAALPNSKLPL